MENLKSQIREVKADLLAQMDGMKADLLGQIQGNTTTTWALFGAMITLYIATFVVVLAVYRNVRPRPEGSEERRRTVQEDVAAEIGKLLGPLREQLRELAEREERLEKQVMALSTQ